MSYKYTITMSSQALKLLEDDFENHLECFMMICW